uniref:Thiamin biosynthesis protein S n=1 Tax=Thaumatella adunca TaxID=2006976 RepID=A0A1Z1MNU1_9FLOR|nr:thiamin biosynthesis protein S [Thaumatella adunca]ARW67529.1 thiamin biosynthesis protein S [Thaumatella adunca]
MQNYLTIFINGEPFNCDHLMSLTDILLYLNIDLNTVIIEYDNQIINKIQFDSTFFKHNESIEVITIVGGG